MRIVCQNTGYYILCTRRRTRDNITHAFTIIIIIVMIAVEIDLRRLVLFQNVSGYYS